MIKKILFFALILSSINLAQEEQGIELPNFVITGIRTVNIPTAKKGKAKLVSTLSKEFFTPAKSPENFKLTPISSPIFLDTTVNYRKMPYNGNLYLGGGINTLPKGKFNYNIGTRHFLFSSQIFGFAEKDYLKYAGYNMSGACLATDFFISTKSSFLPGTKVRVEGKYLRDDYNFYATTLPYLERRTNFLNISASLVNEYYSGFRYGMNFTGNRYELKKANSIVEDILKVTGYLHSTFSRFKVIGKGEIATQKYSSSISNRENTFIKLNGGVALSPINNIDLNFGVNYAKLESKNHFAPYVKLSTTIANRTSFYAEYEPHSDFHTVRTFISNNKYALLKNVKNLFVKYTSYLKAMIKYEYPKYFEINGGFELSKIDNYPFYNLNLVNNFIELDNKNDVEQTIIFANILFHTSLWGSFYGDVNYSQSKFSNEKEVPHQPKVKINFIYDYTLSNLWKLKFKMNYFSETYAESKNLIKIPQYINLGMNISYNFSNSFSFNLDFNNLLNRKNYIVANYKEMPFDVILGINYKW